MEGLAAGGGAGVISPLTLLQAQEGGYQHGRLILEQEEALPEGAAPHDVERGRALSGNGQALGGKPAGLGGKALLPEQRHEFLPRGFQAIHPQGQGRNAVIGETYLLRPLSPPAPEPSFNEPGRVGEPAGKILNRLLPGGRQLLPPSPPGQSPEHGIHKPRRAPVAEGAGEVHRFVHRRVCGDLVGEKELVGPEPEHVPDGDGKPSQGAAVDGLENEIKAPPPAKNPEKNLAHEGPVKWRQFPPYLKSPDEALGLTSLLRPAEGFKHLPPGVQSRHAAPFHPSASPSLRRWPARNARAGILFPPSG